MKILIVSDTHGRDRNFESVLLRTHPVDGIFHLGDVEGSEAYIEDICPCPLYMVSGNNDFFSSAPSERIVEIEGYRIFMTHGHRYGVDHDRSRLRDKAREQGCHMAFCGHTHRPLIDMDADIIVVNPGSLTYPRQENRRPSYVIMDICQNEEPKFTIYYL